MIAWLGLSFLFLFHLLNQPLILETSGFGYDDEGNYTNAQIIWDFSSKTDLRLPDHYLADINNENHNLATLESKYYFITFWATWCGPCMEEKEELENLKQEFAHNQNIEFIDISFDTEKKKWEKFLKESNPNGLQLIANNQQTLSRKLHFAVYTEQVKSLKKMAIIKR